MSQKKSSDQLLIAATRTAKAALADPLVFIVMVSKKIFIKNALGYSRSFG